MFLIPNATPHNPPSRAPLAFTPQYFIKMLGNTNVFPAFFTSSCEVSAARITAAIMRYCPDFLFHLLPRLFFVGGAENLPPTLSKAEEAACIARLVQGDPSAKQILIERNLRLVAYVAKRFDHGSDGLDDLISIGTIGLIKAINSFDAGKNIKLATYASRCIENEILMFLRKTASRRVEISLDEPLSSDADGSELLLGDVLGTESDEITQSLEDEADRMMLLKAVDRLPIREQEIITLRFGLYGCSEQTQKEVADRLGISQSYISRLEKRIINRLRRELLQENVR